MNEKSKLINDNDLATIVLCTDLGIKNRKLLKPLSTLEWSDFVRELISNKMQPKDIFNDNVQDILITLKINNSFIERVVNLLKRSANVSLELNEYFNKGIYVITRSNPRFPRHIKEKLKDRTPPVLFYAGNLELCNDDCIAFVGSRKITPKIESTTKSLASVVVDSGYTIVSGGAKGIDFISENSCLENGGKAISIVSDSLETRIIRKDIRNYISASKLLLISLASPNSRFSVINAMNRNKCIYSLSEYSFVIHSTLKKGGTWNGAVEAINHSLSNVVVLDDLDQESGNYALITKYKASKATLVNIQSEGLDVFLASINEKKEVPKLNSKEKKPKQMQLF